MSKFSIFCCSIFMLLICTIISTADAKENFYTTLYASPDLEGFYHAAECNPGNVSDCPCSIKDVAFEQRGDHAVITSNPGLNHTYVNAIVGYAITENYPDGRPIHKGIYRYSGQMRIPSIPAADLSRTDIPQAAHMVMFFWDGRNALSENNKISFEAGMFWSLNPWDPNKGKIYIYTAPIQPVETGIVIEPDTQWHDIEMVVDFTSMTYLSLSIDGMAANVAGIPVAQVFRPDWGNELALLFSAESMAAWPLQGCPFAFSWSVYYRNIEFGLFED
ncbi:MAG: hypothetical protein HQK61_01165 [Desulfamplus sp.]|nr:hypothetical protein [Desulfamplus sp.]